MNRLSPENLERWAHEIVGGGALTMAETVDLAKAYIASRSANRLALEIIDRAGAMVWSDTRVAVFDALFFAGACNALEQALKMGDAFEREPEELVTPKVTDDDFSAAMRALFSAWHENEELSQIATPSEDTLEAIVAAVIAGLMLSRVGAAEGAAA